MTTDDRPWVPWNPATDPKPAQGARIRHEYGFNFDLGRYFIHPDDAPDLDADLVDRAVTAVTDLLAEQRSLSHEDYVRAVLAVVRESEAGV